MIFVIFSSGHLHQAQGYLFTTENLGGHFKSLASRAMCYQVSIIAMAYRYHVCLMQLNWGRVSVPCTTLPRLFRTQWWHVLLNLESFTIIYSIMVPDQDTYKLKAFQGYISCWMIGGPKMDWVLCWLGLSTHWNPSKFLYLLLYFLYLCLQHVLTACLLFSNCHSRDLSWCFSTNIWA